MYVCKLQQGTSAIDPAASFSFLLIACASVAIEEPLLLIE
jgi:hypothetical protein